MMFQGQVLNQSWRPLYPEREEPGQYSLLKSKTCTMKCRSTDTESNGGLFAAANRRPTSVITVCELLTGQIWRQKTRNFLISRTGKSLNIEVSKFTFVLASNTGISRSCRKWFNLTNILLIYITHTTHVVYVYRCIIFTLLVCFFRLFCYSLLPFWNKSAIFYFLRNKLK